MMNTLALGIVVLWTLVSCSVPRRLADGGPARGSADCETLYWWKNRGEMLAYPPSMPEGPNTEVAEAHLNLMVASIHDYCRHRGEWPASIADLVDLGRALPRGTRCALVELREDPWGTPYRYTNYGATYALSSAGPDRAFGSADDIPNAPATHPRSERFTLTDLCRTE